MRNPVAVGILGFEGDLQTGEEREEVYQIEEMTDEIIHGFIGCIYLLFFFFGN